MREIVTHLHSLGHRRCAYLGGPRHVWSNRERLRGLHAATRAIAFELQEFGPFEPKFEGGIQGADRALDARATAIVAYNDLMALGVLSRLAARGVRVPDDVSVTGFDDLLYASMCAPPLTTVSMPMEAAGNAAVDLLLALGAPSPSSAEAAHRVELGTRLILRATTAAPANAPRASRRPRAI